MSQIYFYILLIDIAITTLQYITAITIILQQLAITILQQQKTQGPIGSLYRAGPKPFFTRIFNPETYDQAVLKYMAQDGSCDRKEAQGNMDAFLDNPQDWGYQKMEEKNKGKVKKDYANANMGTKQVVLSTVWGGGVIYFLGDLTYKVLGNGVMAESFGRTKEILGF